MVLVSLLIRKNMEESPMFAKAKAEGNISKNPLKESFGNKLNLKYVLLALFGATMGQGLVWYTGQFYAQTFLLKICNLDDIQTNMILVIGLLLGTPLFVIFGALSDKIGRKGIMMAGMIIAVFSYRPIFDQMYKTVDVTNKTVVPGSEKRTLKGKTTTITKEFTDGSSYKNVITEVSLDKTESKISIKINEKDQWTLVGYVFFLISFVTMAYGPIAAFLVEMFPTKIRYTSMSLPYHIGNGVFGGLMPAIATFLVSNAQTAGVVQKPYLEGLNYPIALISVCVVIGIIYIKSDKKAA
jgi:MFS family permease